MGQRKVSMSWIKYLAKSPERSKLVGGMMFQRLQYDLMASQLTVVADSAKVRALVITLPDMGYLSEFTKQIAEQEIL